MAEAPEDIIRLALDEHGRPRETLVDPAKSSEDYLRAAGELERALQALEARAAVADKTDFTALEPIRQEIERDILFPVQSLLDQAAAGEPVTRQGALEPAVLRKFASLGEKSRRLKDWLLEWKRKIFLPLRQSIKIQLIKPEALRQKIARYRSSRLHPEAAEWFVNGMLDMEDMPSPEASPSASGFHYEPSSAAEIMEAIEAAPITQKDTVVDLGSGLGKAPLLIHLLTGALTKGVEYNPGYHAYAETKRKELSLERVEFLLQDAREADYSQATVFYLFCPFAGKVFDEVMRSIQQQAKNRKIKICAIAMDVKKPWLKEIYAKGQLKIFESV